MYIPFLRMPSRFIYTSIFPMSLYYRNTITRSANFRNFLFEETPLEIDLSFNRSSHHTDTETEHITN